MAWDVTSSTSAPAPYQSPSSDNNDDGSDANNNNTPPQQSAGATTGDAAPGPAPAPAPGDGGNTGGDSPSSLGFLGNPPSTGRNGSLLANQSHGVATARNGNSASVNRDPGLSTMAARKPTDIAASLPDFNRVNLQPPTDPKTASAQPNNAVLSPQGQARLQANTQKFYDANGWAADKPFNFKDNGSLVSSLGSMMDGDPKSISPNGRANGMKAIDQLLDQHQQSVDAAQKDPSKPKLLDDESVKMLQDYRTQLANGQKPVLQAPDPQPPSQAKRDLYRQRGWSPDVIAGDLSDPRNALQAVAMIKNQQPDRISPHTAATGLRAIDALREYSLPDGMGPDLDKLQGDLRNQMISGLTKPYDELKQWHQQKLSDQGYYGSAMSSLNATLGSMKQEIITKPVTQFMPSPLDDNPGVRAKQLEARDKVLNAGRVLSTNEITQGQMDSIGRKYDGMSNLLKHMDGFSNSDFLNMVAMETGPYRDKDGKKWDNWGTFAQSRLQDTFQQNSASDDDFSKKFTLAASLIPAFRAASMTKTALGAVSPLVSLAAQTGAATTVAATSNVGLNYVGSQLHGKSYSTGEALSDATDAGSIAATLPLGNAFSSSLRGLPVLGNPLVNNGLTAGAESIGGGSLQDALKGVPADKILEDALPRGILGTVFGSGLSIRAPH